MAIIHSKSRPPTSYIIFAEIGIWGKKLDMLIGAGSDGAPHSLDKFRPAVGINGVVTTMIGYHDST